MNLKEQLYVCTLAKCRNLSRAAEELYISPSALSVYISNLEKYLGTPLFKRTGKAFVLTVMGQAYVKRAKKMLALKEEFDELLRLHQSAGQDTIRIGIQQRRAIDTVPKVLQRFLREYPGADVVFLDTTRQRLIQLYKQGDVDFLLSTSLEEFQEENYTCIGKEQVLLALPANHPACRFAYELDGDRYPHMDIKQLAGETFILPPRGQSMRRTGERILEQAYVRPGKILEIESIATGIAMVNQGLGAGFNRLSYVRNMKEFRNVRYFLIGQDPYCSELALVYRKERQLSACEKRLLEILKEVVQEV